jgi:hypothetical protein
MARKQGSAQPAFYLAAEDLFVHEPESGTMPLAAYRKGDRVSPGVVATYGWAAQVTNPDGELEVAAPEPETVPDKPEPIKPNMPDAAGKE